MHIKVQKAEYVGRFRRPVMADVSHLFKSLFFIDISKTLDTVLSKQNKFFHDPTGNFYIEEKKANNIKCTWINEKNTQEELYFTRLGFCVWFTSNFKLGDNFIIHKKTGKGKFYKLKNYALIKRYKGLEGDDKLFGEQNEQKWFYLKEINSKEAEGIISEFNKTNVDNSDKLKTTSPAKTKSKTKKISKK